jgi:hypothetical protein
MNVFDVQLLAYVLHRLEQLQVRLIIKKLTGEGACDPDASDTNEISSAIFSAETVFSNQQFAECLDVTQEAKRRLQRDGVNVSVAQEIVNRLLGDIVQRAGGVKFIRVKPERSDLVDKNHLFGDLVYQSFPSSDRDLREAGNCIAAECGTAAVFHLMRAAEFSLRALATDRNMEFKDKPLDQAEWGAILGNFEGILHQMRQAPKSMWTDPRFKEAQVRFYSDSVQEFRSFNEAWRRHVSHADKEAFYDVTDAENVMRHVRAFMEKLSSRIGEGKSTPEYWTSE